MELIDKQKLLEWLKEHSDNSHSDIYAASYLSVIVELKSGTFDDHSTQEEIERQYRLLDNEVEIKERLREEIAKLKRELQHAQDNMKMAVSSMEAKEARATQAEQERDELQRLLDNELAHAVTMAKENETLQHEIIRAMKERNAGPEPYKKD